MKYLLLLILLAPILSFSQTTDNRIIVLSGGGSRGAWGGGFLQAMDSAEHPHYVGAIGTSTGSLLGPLILTDKPSRFADLYRGYTQITQRSIFNVNPFKKNGDINGFKAFFRLLFSKKNLGESLPLKKRLVDFYSEPDYQNMRAQQKEFVACVTNLTSGAIEYKSSAQFEYNDMIDWAWASCNQPIFMSTLRKNNALYVDGGIRENIPIEQGVRLALAHHVTRVDVIIHNSVDTTILRTWPEPSNKDGIIPKILRTIDIFSDETRSADIKGGLLAAQEAMNDTGEMIDIHLYSMPLSTFVETNCYNSLIFIQSRQEALWRAGFEHYRSYTSPRLSLQQPVFSTKNLRLFLH
jgi:NTE family protein